MVEQALQIGLNSELQRIFFGVSKNNLYPKPGLRTVMVMRGQTIEAREGILDSRVPTANLSRDSQICRVW